MMHFITIPKNLRSIKDAFRLEGENPSLQLWYLYSLNLCMSRVPTGQGNLFFLQGQGKVREFCKMVREIRKSSKVREF